jgi:hypothetical protein
LRLFGFREEVAVLVGEGLSRGCYQDGLMGRVVIELAKKEGIAVEDELGA